MKFTAVGDMLAQQRIPSDYEGFAEIKEQIEKGDARFINLETTIHNGEFFANQYSGGSYLRITPNILKDIRNFGFNMLTFANNHAMDFSHEGLMATKKYVDEADFPNAGAGANLDEAAAPAYFDTKNGRIALISAVSTVNNNAAMAGKQSRRFIGRPGLNALRIDEHLQVTPEQSKVIEEISALSHINAQIDIERAEGYHPPLTDGVAALKNMVFKKGDETKYITHQTKRIWNVL